MHAKMSNVISQKGNEVNYVQSWSSTAWVKMARKRRIESTSKKYVYIT